MVDNASIPTPIKRDINRHYICHLRTTRIDIEKNDATLTRKTTKRRPGKRNMSSGDDDIYHGAHLDISPRDHLTFNVSGIRLWVGYGE